jgi:hypothetical protein
MSKMFIKMKKKLTEGVLMGIAYVIWFLFQGYFLVNGPLLICIFLAIGILTAIFFSKGIDFDESIKKFEESLKKAAWIVLFMLYLFYGFNFLYVQTQKSEVVALEITGYTQSHRGPTGVHFKFKGKAFMRPFPIREAKEKFGNNFPETCELNVQISQGIGCVYIHKMGIIKKE